MNFHSLCLPQAFPAFLVMMMMMMMSISTPILLQCLFFNGNKAFKHNGDELKKKKFGFCAQALMYSVALSYNWLKKKRKKNDHISRSLVFHAFSFGYSSVNGSGCEDSNLIFVQSLI